MKTTMTTRILSLLLCLVMLVGLMPITAWAYWEEPSAEGDDSLDTTVLEYSQPVGITMNR